LTEAEEEVGFGTIKSGSGVDGSNFKRREGLPVEIGFFDREVGADLKIKSESVVLAGINIFRAGANGVESNVWRNLGLKTERGFAPN